MEKYIINFEDGQNYIADKITQEDIDAMDEGLLSIVRASDCKVLMSKDIWIDLPKWPDCGQPNVIGSFVVPTDYNEGPECEDDGCEFCNDIHCDGSCQEEDW